MTAVLLALASAWAFAVATVVGHRAATTTADTEAGNRGPRALLRRAGRLVRHPGFLAGQLAGGAGVASHAAALSHGLLVVVQPLMCTGMVMTLVLGALVDRRHPGRPLPHRRQWLAAVLVVAGLSLFLGTAAPTAHSAHATGRALPVALAAFAALTGVAVLWVRGGGTRHPAAVLGALSGLGFGLTGVLIKVVVTLPVGRWPTVWPLYALLAVSLVSTVLAQWSYSSGPLVQSQPVLTALEPVVALFLAGPVFGEGLARGLPAHTGQLAGLALMLGGVVAVVRHDAGTTTPPVPPSGVLPPPERGTPRRPPVGAPSAMG